jgi:hypothetical protein
MKAAMMKAIRLFVKNLEDEYKRDIVDDLQKHIEHIHVKFLDQEFLYQSYNLERSILLNGVLMVFNYILFVDGNGEQKSLK